MTELTQLISQMWNGLDEKKKEVISICHPIEVPEGVWENKTEVWWRLCCLVEEIQIGWKESERILQGWEIEQKERKEI